MTLTRRQALITAAGAVASGVLPASGATIDRGLCTSATSAFGFDSYCFTDDQSKTHQLYVADGGGPPVILLHELPGLVDADLDAAMRLAAQKYTVICPLLFGTPGGEGDAYHYYRTVCGPDQFACNKSSITSPHVAWLRQLCRAVPIRWKEGKGVGVIGMCLTGAFPIALMSEPAVVAPVICQPTTPINAWTYLGLFTDQRALGLDPKDIDAAKQAAESRDVLLLGLRFRNDWRCRKPRFERLVDDFGKRFYRLDLPGKHGLFKHSHSTLGGDACPDAFNEILAFFNARLRSTPDPQGGNFPSMAEPGSKTEVRKGICPEPAHH